jgi:hypothetical protein
MPQHASPGALTTGLYSSYSKTRPILMSDVSHSLHARKLRRRSQISVSHRHLFWEPAGASEIGSAGGYDAQRWNQVVETAVEARGGLLGRPVLVVPIASCVLAAGFLLLT